MSTTYTVSLAALLAALGLAAPAQGQEFLCESTETVAECHNRLREKATGAAGSASGTAAGDEADELQRKAAGPNVAENLAQSAIRDFLPRFAGTLLASDPTDDLRALDFRFNTPMGGARPSGFTLQGGVTLHQAELYTPLVEAIPEGMREASRERLAKELEDGDDATGFATLNRESRRFGRNFANHDDLIGRISQAIGRTTARRLGPTPRDFTRFSRKLGDMRSIDPAHQSDPSCVDLTRTPVIPNDLEHLRVDCLTPEVRAEMETALAPLVRYRARQELIMVDLMRDHGFTRLADLVNNQPQLNFSAEYRSRVGVVGPNEWTGRMRVEMGFANMNGLRSRCAPASAADRPDTTARADSALLACLGSYTRSASVRRRLAHSDRLWFEAEARYRPRYHVSLPADSVDFTLGRGSGFGLSAGYGRYLGSVDREDEDRDRIDLHVSYDHADGEDLRQSRFLTGLFYTLRISGSASGVVGLAWASKPEFLEGADRRLHANLGLSYKFNRGTEGR